MLILLLAICVACIDEIQTPVNEEAYISIDGIISRAHNGVHDGDSEDYIVNTLRVMAFDAQGDIKSNKLYNIGVSTTVKHPIETGIYNLMFIANEPHNVSVVNALDGVTSRNDFDTISFPASAFTAKEIIPMIQRVDNVEILSGGKIKVDGGSETSLLKLTLNRLGVRLDIILKAKENLSQAFAGLTFSNIPDRVPLSANYNVAQINRNETRTLTPIDDGSHFSDEIPSETDIVWQKKVTRIIVPSNYFTPTSAQSNAIKMTVNLEDKYNPDANLRIENNNYTLPANTKLDVIATIKMPLEVNIKASEWNPHWNNWIIDGERKLNVSQIEATITPLNGVRISFSSNMPHVWVAENCYDQNNQPQLTAALFNELVGGWWNNENPTRFTYNYDPTTGIGEGYMDIIIQGSQSGFTVGQINQHKLVLCAGLEKNDNGNLQREITINTNMLFDHGYYNEMVSRTDYVSTFHKHSERGERVISNFRNFTTWNGTEWNDVREFDPNGVETTDHGWFDYQLQWKAKIISGDDFFVISPTPSFDPNLGTDTPDNPERYPVTDGKTEITGYGRTYFRVGMKNQYATGSTNKYGAIEVTVYDYSIQAIATYTIYVRQGETDDYLMRPGDAILDGPMQGAPRSKARKVPVYNLTAPEFKTNPWTTTEYVKLTPSQYTGGPGYANYFTNYPSQAGSHFLGMIPSYKDAAYTAYQRRAYTPFKDIISDWIDKNNGVMNDWEEENYGTIYWGTGTNRADNEVCPPGYHRPIDWSETSRSGEMDTQAALAWSEIRQSLFQNPSSGVVNYSQSGKLNAVWGKVADGFYDRHRTELWGSLAVSNTNANAAYAGTLFYNPNNYASVFFPGAGRRDAGYEYDIIEESGKLMYTGGAGYYWTTAMAPIAGVVEHGSSILFVSGPLWDKSVAFMGLSANTYGLSVRCFVTEYISVR